MVAVSVQIMPLSIDSGPSIKKILKKVDVFSETEVSVALELVDKCLNGTDEYRIHVAIDNNDSQILGFICFGKRPLTDGVYDLYWIAVFPEYQNKGIGQKLLMFLEKEILYLGGRLILTETSSRPQYMKSRRFYTKNGYNLIASINDFYSLNDTLLIYGKYLNKIYSAK